MKASTEEQSAQRLIPDFRGEEAFSFLRAQTDFGPRNPNSRGHKNCLDYLMLQLQKNADKVIRQDFLHKGYKGELLQLTNVIGSFRPDNPSRILLLAHWDTRPRADMDPDFQNRNKPILGANDGASGVAILLALAQMMKVNPPRIGVDILLVDGEDYGESHDLDRYALGSRHFAETKSSSYQPKFGILLDMVGDRDLKISMEQNSIRYAPDAVRLVWDTAEQLRITQFVNIPGEEIFDDHIPLNKAGIPTLDIIDFEYPYWHTTQDSPDKCSAESLEAVGKVITHVLYNYSTP